MAYAVDKAGIYCITTPTNKIYVGQSRNIQKRMNVYSSLTCKSQVKLLNALKKYSLKECNVDILHSLNKSDPQLLYNFFEVLFIEGFKEEGWEMLNIRAGGSRGKNSKSTREKISKHHKENPNSGVFKKGHIVSSATKKRQSMSKKGKATGRVGVSYVQKAVAAARIANKGHNYNGKPVINKETGEIYSSAKKAAASLPNVSYSAFRAMISGQNTNKTAMVYSNV